MKKLKLFALFAAMLFATSMWAADPTGCVDAWQGHDGSIYIKGWAFDSQNTNAALAIHVYMYKSGVADPVWSEGNTVANSSRPDVNNVHHCGNNHGFERYISTANLSPGTYWINIWAIHAAGTDGTNVRLHAATNENQYDFTITVKSPLTISYDANGGSNAPGSQQKCYGININLQGKGSLARSGYTTDGWATSATGNKAYNFGASYSGNASTKLYAHWTANKYTVTLDQQGGSGGSSSVQATYDANMPSMTKPTRTGYTFQGYYDATSGGTQYYKADGTSARTWNKTSNATLYARWTANTYTITLDPQGGSGGDASKTATFGQATPTVNIPGRNGYSFAGYYTGKNGSGTQYLKPDANNTATSVRNWDIASNTTLYAKWNARTYSLTFDQQGGNGGTAAATATFDAAMPAATMPTRDGYDFKGYYDAATEGTLYYNADGSSARAWNKTAAATLYARWEIINYTIAYNLDGGEATNPTEYTVETETFTLNNPTKEGYIFLGWTGSNGETPQTEVTIAQGSTGDKNYVANWTALKPCELGWMNVPEGGVVGTIGHEDEIVLPQINASPDFILAYQAQTVTLRLGSTDESVLKVFGFNNFQVIGVGECDVYAVHDEDAVFAYDSAAFHVTVNPEPTPEPTVWTSLAVGDVIKVGDQLNPSEEWESANDYGVIKPDWAPYTLVRANIVQEHEWDDPVVTEAEDGAYYVFRFTHPTSGTSYLLANSAKSPLLAATATSDGLEVTNVGEDYGTPAFTFAVHDNPVTPTAVENVQTNEVQATKFFRDGQLLIEKNGKTYNAQGAVVR